MAILSIMGMYDFNNSVFDGFRVPRGLDRETCISEILLECAELELVYPSFNTMKLAITQWSKIEQPIWEKLFNTEKLEYNPIWNVDGDVVETRELTRAKTGNDSLEFSRSETGSETMSGETGKNNTITTEDHTEGTTQNAHSKAGYNSSDMVTTDRDDGSTDSDASGTRTENETGTSSETITSSNTGNDTQQGSNAENESIGESVHTRRTGNIGVTTTQQMIREERDVATFSTYKYIVNSFKQRFCLLVY